MSGLFCPNYLLFNIGKLISGLDTMLPFEGFIFL